MDNKSDYKKIYKESFKDSPEFIEMFFEDVYSPEELLMLDIDGTPVSGLLLQKYKMNFHTESVPTGYICAAATARKMRGHGYMTELIKESIREAYNRGDVFLSLQPANRALSFFYDRLGFTTVFYIQEERYTSAHSFGGNRDDFNFSLSPDSQQVRDTFLTLYNLRDGSLRLSDKKYDIILKDTLLDGGRIVSAYNPVTATVDAVAVAVTDRDDRIIVREIVSVSDIAREALLGEIHRTFGHKQMIVETPVNNNRKAPIESRGMVRLINARAALEVLARTSKHIRAAVRVHDSIIQQNNHIYIVDRGNVTINDGFGGNLDLDVSQEVLTSILFSAPKVGGIFNLPTVRPYMSLMLE